MMMFLFSSGFRARYTNADLADRGPEGPVMECP
jgi:hypothetical protein